MKIDMVTFFISMKLDVFLLLAINAIDWRLICLTNKGESMTAKGLHTGATCQNNQTKTNIK